MLSKVGTTCLVHGTHSLSPHFVVFVNPKQMPLYSFIIITTSSISLWSMWMTLYSWEIIMPFLPTLFTPQQIASQLKIQVISTNFLDLKLFPPLMVYFCPNIDIFKIFGLNQFSYGWCKRSSNSTKLFTILNSMDGSPSVDPTPYRKLVGSLQYLAFTRPNVSFAINHLAQFMHAPTQTHWQAFKRVLWYLKGIIHHGLFLKRGAILTSRHFRTWIGEGSRMEYIQLLITYSILA